MSAVLIVLTGAVIVELDKSHSRVVLERLESMAEDQGSGRLDIYSETIKYIANSTPWQTLMGHGYVSTRDILASGKSAHNDWLEVQFDFGAVGLLLYALLHACLIRKSHSLIRGRSPLAAAFAASYALFFFMSMTSHLIIYPTYYLFLVAFWGMIEGLTRRERRECVRDCPPVARLRRQSRGVEV
jgi:O-antigen ligase